MIDENELRPGNYILHKTGVRILPVRCTAQHLLLLQNGEKNIYPVVLKAGLLESCGFIENKKYALLPQAREFVMEVPVPGGADLQIRGYVKANGECFARAMMAQITVSASVHHLHQLQNLYYSITGTELQVSI